MDDWVKPATKLLIISKMELIRSEIKDAVSNLPYQILALGNINDLATTLNEYSVKAVIFDIHNNFDEGVKFLNILKFYSSVSILFLGNIDHTLDLKLRNIENKVTSIPLPINQKMLKEKLQVILDNLSVYSSPLLNFVNQSITELLNLVPREHKKAVNEALAYALSQISQEAHGLYVEDGSNILLQRFEMNEDSLQPYLKKLLLQIIDSLDDITFVEYGGAIITDSILQALYKTPSEKRQPLVEFLYYCSFDNISLYEKLNLESDSSQGEMKFQIGFVKLEDMGPTLSFEINSGVFGEVFNGLTNGQLISLVGQGELYHEGLFGPLPISMNPDLMTVIYSKKLKDEEIMDSRLDGMTLSVISIVFRKKFITKLPSREILTSIFEPFIKTTNVSEITPVMLHNIEQLLVRTV